MFKKGKGMFMVYPREWNGSTWGRRGRSARVPLAENAKPEKYVIIIINLKNNSRRGARICAPSSSKSPGDVSKGPKYQSEKGTNERGEKGYGVFVSDVFLEICDSFKEGIIHHSNMRFD
jgi:hypothetical protein